MRKPKRFSIPDAHPRSALTWFVLGSLFALLAWIYWPATRGDFVADDYVFLATSRMVSNPLAAFWQSHFFEPYYFRPLGVLSWWAATRVFGFDYAPHSAINLILHALNAGLLFGLLRALALRTSAVIAGVALFAVGPFSLATIVWPSNRFDILVVGFLLAQAIAMVRALQGSALAFFWAALATLGACWSKESAYAIATMMCLVALAANGASWRLRGTLFVLLGGVISSAFFWRHRIVSDAYAIASSDPVGQVIDGARVMVLSAPKLTELITSASISAWFGWGALGACLLAMIWRRREAEVSRGVVGAAILVLLAAVVTQTPLAKAFAPMLDGVPFGTVTFARFFYAPWAAASILVALLLARGRLGAIVAVALMGVTVAAGISARPLVESFVEWTRREITPVSTAATALVDAGNDVPCVYVLLGTQIKQPYFRMFSDVTVKARTVSPEKTWRCHVITESTPWLLAFPADTAPLALPLRTVGDGVGVAKPDSVWSSIRYRYRWPAKNLAALPGARFFEWRDGRFIEVSEEVRSGARKVASRDW